MKTQECTKCGIEKSLDEFYDRSDRIGKKKSSCKLCCNKDTQKHYSENKEKFKVYRKNWIEKNPNKMSEYSKNHYEKNKNKKIKRQNELRKDKRKNNPEYRLRINIKALFQDRFRRELKNKKNRFFSYTGISMQEYIDHFKKSEYWEDFCNNGDIHIDHIIPKCYYDYNSPEEIKMCWQLENLRLLPSIENIKKSNKIDINLIKKHNIEHLIPKRLKNAI